MGGVFDGLLQQSPLDKQEHAIAGQYAGEYIRPANSGRGQILQQHAERQ